MDYNDLKREKNDSLVGTHPTEVLSHGPKKLLLSKYNWHLPDVGIVASYTPTDNDVEDHFGIFRGVDQIEAFAQATIVSCGAFLEKRKTGDSFDALKRKFVTIFIGVGQVNFHSYLEKGDTFVSIGYITFYKFRQMVSEGRIYKVPKGLDLDDYFSTFNEERLRNYQLGKGFTLITELAGVTGRALKKDKFY